MSNSPIDIMKFKSQDLAKFLRALADAVESGDSLEGRITYTAFEDHLKPKEFEVTGGVRTGNTEGQGGWSILEHSVPEQNQQQTGV